MSPDSTLEARVNRTPWLDPVSGGLPQVPSREALPTATADHYGRLIHVPGTPSAVYICLKTSGGAYYWASMFVADGDKGDITVSANGATWNIDAGAVGTPELADDAATYAKIQNVSATDRLLGRDTAGAGNIEELTVTAPLAFTGSGGLAVTVSATDRILGRDTAGAGNAEELTVTAPLAFTGSGGLTVTDVVRVLDRDNNGSSGTGPQATTTETTIYTVSVPANTLPANSSLRVTLIGEFNQGSAACTVTFRLKFGGTTEYTQVTASGALGGNYPFWAQITITNIGATNAQHWGGRIVIAPEVPDTDPPLFDAGISESGVIDTTSTQALTVTAQLSDNNASNYLKVYSAILELL